MDDQTLNSLLNIQSSVNAYLSSKNEKYRHEHTLKIAQSNYEEHKQALADDIQRLRTNTLKEPQLHHLLAKAIVKSHGSRWPSQETVEKLIQEIKEL